MTDLVSIESLFTAMGGQFVRPAEEIQAKLKTINTLIFDWDGVFHDGHKDHQGVSLYSEADSMGVNMLRFGVWMQQGETIPFTAVISGEHNPTAAHWATRDNLNLLMMGFNHKAKALTYLQEEYGVRPENTLFVFDDILDLSLAEHCGLRLMVRKKANPLLHRYCIDHGLADYITGCESGNHAVREVSELCLALLGRFEEVITHRKDYTDYYGLYNKQRKAIRLEKVLHNYNTGIITRESKSPIGFKR